MSPRFSIIVPVYNVAPYLRECLDSVLAQTFTDWEAICVDDGSTDGSGAILDEYAAKDRRFSVIHQENAGVSIARQVALERSQGEWIAAVDPDDWVEPDYFAKLLEATMDGAVDMVWCDFTEERESGTHVIRQDIASDTRTQVLALLNGSLWGGLCMRLIRRDFIVRHRVAFLRMRITVCEDLFFVASVLAAGARAKYTDATGYHYRIRVGSSVHQRVGLLKYMSLMTVADCLELMLKEDWAKVPLMRWRKEHLCSPYLNGEIPDNMFYAHNGGYKDLWGVRVPFHHKLMYWLAARGCRRFLIRTVAMTRRWRGLK